jgi:hypothetical protein
VSCFVCALWVIYSAMNLVNLTTVVALHSSGEEKELDDIEELVGSRMLQVRKYYMLSLALLVSAVLGMVAEEVFFLFLAIAVPIVFVIFRQAQADDNSLLHFFASNPNHAGLAEQLKKDRWSVGELRQYLESSARLLFGCACCAVERTRAAAASVAESYRRLEPESYDGGLLERSQGRSTAEPGREQTVRVPSIEGLREQEGEWHFSAPATTVSASWRRAKSVMRTTAIFLPASARSPRGLKAGGKGPLLVALDGSLRPDGGREQGSRRLRFERSWCEIGAVGTGPGTNGCGGTGGGFSSTAAAAGIEGGVLCAYEDHTAEGVFGRGGTSVLHQTGRLRNYTVDGVQRTRAQGEEGGVSGAEEVFCLRLEPSAREKRGETWYLRAADDATTRHWRQLLIAHGARARS